MSLLTCENLMLGYDGAAVLKNVRFTVEPGDYLCIVGENGSGKSTLMKTILGLIPPLSGKILFGEGMSQTQIGYLPQQTQVQRDFPASVWEVVLSGCHNGIRPFYRKTEKERARAAMERLHITNLSCRCYRELSGGQQQRVLLARALCATQKMLLLDEPVTGLDPTATAEFYEMTAQLNREGVAIMMISHDLRAAMDHASHILHVGESVFFGSREAYEMSSIGFRGKGGESHG